MSNTGCRPGKETHNVGLCWIGMISVIHQDHYISRFIPTHWGQVKVLHKSQIQEELTTHQQHLDNLNTRMRRRKFKKPVAGLILVLYTDENCTPTTAA